MEPTHNWRVPEAPLEAREEASASAVGSLRAEGLTSSPEADAISARWVAGEISTAEMEQQIAALHGAW